MDDADKAEQQAEMYLRSAIDNARNRKQKKLVYIGKCHYCRTDVNSPKLYCDGHCATKHSKQRDSK